MSKLDKRLQVCNLKIILVVIFTTSGLPVYRVYTSDGGFTDYMGYDMLPLLLREWIKDRNNESYCIQNAFVVSGCEV